MELEGYLDMVDADTIRVRGHRVDIAHVLASYHEGYSTELIALELPSLSLEEVYGVLTYYLHNRAAGDAMESREKRRLSKHSTRCMIRYNTSNGLAQGLCVLANHHVLSSTNSICGGPGG
jgi:uncharacterized protein (DUF433 family)